MWIPRAIEPGLRKLAATPPVVVLTGARQTGKTSTLRRLFPNHEFVSLDRQSVALDPGGLRAGNPARALVFEPDQVDCEKPQALLNDTGLLCALLSIRDTDALMTSPSADAVWETFVLGQLRHRDRVLGRERSLFFWRDHTREVDFVIENAGVLELFEAKWTELPDAADWVNLRFVREVVGRRKVKSATVVCRAVPVEELI